MVYASYARQSFRLIIRPQICLYSGAVYSCFITCILDIPYFSSVTGYDTAKYSCPSE